MATLVAQTLVHPSLDIAAPIIMLAPLMWMITLSLKPSELTYCPPYLIPTTFQWSNYVDAWQAANFPRYYLNTAIMALGITVGQVLFLFLYAAYRFRAAGVSRAKCCSSSF
ncbi:MAG: hypothetical protein U0452_09800 [Anaerolineae bacterium]